MLIEVVQNMAIIYKIHLKSKFLWKILKYIYNVNTPKNYQNLIIETVEYFLVIKYMLNPKFLQCFLYLLKQKNHKQY